MKAIIPFLVMSLCVAMYFLYVKPQIGVIYEKRDKIVEYQKVLDQVKEISKKREELTQKYDNISEENRDKLDKMIPEKFNLELFANDINAVAVSKNIKISKMSEGASRIGGATENTTESDLKYKTKNVSFDASGHFDQLILFLKDLESNLRIIDVVGVTINPRSSEKSKTAEKEKDPGAIDYSIEIKTYSLK